MSTLLRKVALTPQDPKNQDIEIQEIIGDLLDSVLKERNIELSDDDASQMVYNLRKIINYQNTTDEDVKNYFNSYFTIIGK